MKNISSVASAALAAAALLSISMAASAATPTPQAARALDYLATQQQADGSLPDGLGENLDYILGAKFQGLDPNNLKASSGKTVYDYLATWVANSTACPPKATNPRDGNTIGKLVQAVVAGGHNPTSFGGRNLLSDLEGMGGTASPIYDPSTGAFLDCASSGQNAVYAQANAILGLEVAASPQYPVPPAAIQHLRSLQSTAGGWGSFGNDNTNATAMALMALAPQLNSCTGADPALLAALRFLHTQQDPTSGGMAYSNLGPYGSPASDPDSDALVIQALVDAGENPGGSAWSNSKGSPATDILTFQNSTSGGFSFDHSSTPDAFTTSQVPAGLDRGPFPDGTPDAVAVSCPVSPSPSTAVVAAAPRLPRAGRPAPPSPAAALALAWTLAAVGLLIAVRSARAQRGVANA